jgi:hypothetical protein
MMATMFFAILAGAVLFTLAATLRSTAGRCGGGSCRGCDESCNLLETDDDAPGT